MIGDRPGGEEEVGFAGAELLADLRRVALDEIAADHLAALRQCGFDAFGVRAGQDPQETLAAPALSEEVYAALRAVLLADNRALPERAIALIARGASDPRWAEPLRLLKAEPEARSAVTGSAQALRARQASHSA